MIKRSHQHISRVSHTVGSSLCGGVCKIAPSTTGSPSAEPLFLRAPPTRAAAEPKLSAPPNVSARSPDHTEFDEWSLYTKHISCTETYSPSRTNTWFPRGLVAETKGFEPSRRFPAYSLSRGAPSTTRPRLRRREYVSNLRITTTFLPHRLGFDGSCSGPVIIWVCASSGRAAHRSFDGKPRRKGAITILTIQTSRVAVFAHIDASEMQVCCSETDRLANFVRSLIHIQLNCTMRFGQDRVSHRRHAGQGSTVEARTVILGQA